MSSYSQNNAREQILKLYEDMYQAMVAKDRTALYSIHADDFVLVHMTGMRQTRQQYVDAIVDGTLNYYGCETENLDVVVNGENATLTGRSRVEAAVFGGGRHVWRLQLTMKLRMTDGTWRIVESRASAY